MRLHPLHSIKMIADHMRCTGEYFPAERCTGRTTAQSLRMVAYCINHPHTVIRPIDHNNTLSSNRRLVMLCRDLVSCLGLVGFGFTSDTMWLGTACGATKDMA